MGFWTRAEAEPARMAVVDPDGREVTYVQCGDAPAECEMGHAAAVGAATPCPSLRMGGRDGPAPRMGSADELGYFS